MVPVMHRAQWSGQLTASRFRTPVVLSAASVRLPVATARVPAEPFRVALASGTRVRSRPGWVVEAPSLRGAPSASEGSGEPPMTRVSRVLNTSMVRAM